MIYVSVYHNDLRRYLLYASTSNPDLEFVFPGKIIDITCFEKAFKEMTTTPVFLPGESHGGRSRVGYSPCGCKKSDMTEQLRFLSLDGQCHNVVINCCIFYLPYQIISNYATEHSPFH